MKILNVNVDIGDVVMIEEKFDKNIHYIKHNRIHVGFVDFLDSNGNIALRKKILVKPKQLEIKRLKDFLKLFYNIGIINFGQLGQIFLNQVNIKSIKILKGG